MKTIDKLKKVFEGTGLESYQYEDCENADELIANLETQIDEDEVIYYSNAIKYLAENDASLRESIDLAVELDYELKNVNSELLATLLQQKNLRDELYTLKSRIEEAFEE